MRVGVGRGEEGWEEEGWEDVRVGVGRGKEGRGGERKDLSVYLLGPLALQCRCGWRNTVDLQEIYTMYMYM